MERDWGKVEGKSDGVLVKFVVKLIRNLVKLVGNFQSTFAAFRNFPQFP
jgi:hypothetical protein